MGSHVKEMDTKGIEDTVEGDNTKSKILVVDDNKHLLVDIHDHLAYEGYEVQTAISAEKALAYIEAPNPNYPDLVILDISMPGIGGIGFLKRMNELKEQNTDYSGVEVMVLTARTAMRNFFMTEGIGICGFVEKPCDMGDLLGYVKKALSPGQQEGNQTQYSPTP